VANEVDLIKYIGAMDLDSALEDVPKGWHTYARNVEWQGIKGNMRPRNTPGTRLITYSLPAGNNVCIGRFFEKVNNQEYYFNYNSNGTHGIYIFDVVLEIITPLIVNGTNTNGDILGFNANVTIQSIWMIYGDENSGNLLFWLDSLGRPSKCNVQRYLGLLVPSSPPYNPINRSYLDVVKAPPRMAPKCCYGNDPNVNANFMTDRLFQFRTRYRYDDNETSVYSQPSIVALPNQSFSQTAIFDPTQNCLEYIYFPTGNDDVTFVELWVQITTNGTTSDWQLIYSFEKAVLNIPNNSVWLYKFYNNVILTNGVTAEIDQIFDVLDTANAGCLLNGNVNAYGDITEGQFPVPNLNIKMSSTNIQAPADNMNGILFFAVQGSYDSDGEGNQITVYLIGAGSTFDSNGNPTNIPQMVRTWIVSAGDSNGDNHGFQYDNDTNANIPSILAALASAAVTAGYALVTTNPNSIVLSLSGVTLYSTSNIRNDFFTENQAVYAYPHQDNEQWAIGYFDDKGRIFNAQIFPNNNLTTLPDLTGQTIPLNSFSIYHRPPIYARYWAMLRGINPPNPLFWICNQTFVNTDLNTGNQFVYIGISNMPLYDEDIEAANPVVNYDFAPGDRIQFLASIPLTGVFQYLSVKNDYPIVSVEDSPILNGIIQPGSFIKIAYPTSAIGPGFTFGTDDFQRYYIRIYHPQLVAAGANLEEYFEAGRLYAIGNHGTDNAYHIANSQSQTPTLSQPAILTTSDGPYIARQRNVPTGLQYNINMIVCAFSQHSQTFTTQASQQDQGVITNTQYQINEQIQNGVGFGPGNFPQYDGVSNGDKAIFWNKLNSPQTLRLRGTIPFNSTISGTLFGALYFMNSSNVPPSQFQYLFKNFAIQETSTVQSYSQPVDVEIVIPSNTQAWLFFGFLPNESTNFTTVIGGWSLLLQVVNPIQIPIIESSFSDIMPIVKNSNGRSFIYNENAGRYTFGARYRYSLQYQFGTNENNSNKFFTGNFDELVNAHGSIIRMITGWDKNMLAFQERRICVVGVFQKFITNNEGQTQMVVSDVIITQNNAQYYAFPFGLGTQPDALASYEYAVYGIDPILGIIWRLSRDGLTSLSQDYRVQTWSGNNLPPYLNAANNSYGPGGKVKILGTYHTKKDLPAEYVLVAQVGSGVNGDTLTFDEKNNSFTGFHDVMPDMIDCVGNTLLSWKNGQLYVHDATGNGEYTTFYGVQYFPSVTHIFNDRTEFKKTFNTIQYDSNQIWEAFNIGDINTSLFDPNSGLQQMSQLIAEDFYVNEGRTFAAFLRDAKSNENQITGLLSGDFLKGVYCSVKLTYRGNNFAYLHNVAITWAMSGRNF
jgi:hypothetical protein